MYPTVLNKIRQFTLKSFEEADSSQLYYHNQKHTEAVVDQVAVMNPDADERSQHLLQMAAYLHDIGYLYGYERHEERSIKIAKQHYAKWGLSNDDFQEIEAAIAATELGVSPSTLLAALLADADLFYGVGAHFFQHGPLLRKEWEVCKNQYYSELEWETLQLNFLQHIQFESSYGKEHFSPIVAVNLEKQEAILKKITKDA